MSEYVLYKFSHKGRDMKSNLQDVMAKFPAEVLARYDFSQAVYHGALERMTGVVCREHGAFSQYPAQFRRNGSGCPSCGDLIRRAKRRLPQHEAIEAAKKRHAGFYTYERTVYVNSTTKFTVTCPVHGDFSIMPNGHIHSGKGCPSCANIKRGHRRDPAKSARKTADAKIAKFSAKFIKEARAVHGDTYDYSRAVYTGQKAKLTIICPDHGPFEQAPDHHVQRANGCPECSHHRSKGEASLAKFMASLAEIEQRNRRIIPPKELDIYVPSSALAIEYCGEYWHASRSVEEEPEYRLRHIHKQQMCEQAGIRLMTVYESEWLKRQGAIKRLIRNAMGKMRGRLMARKCDVEIVPIIEALAFFEAYHPQGGAGWGINYGLRYNGKLVACMRFAFGNNDRGANSERVWTLSRYATRLPVSGGASRLFSAFVAEHDPESVKSFSDNRYFTGGMYQKLGFVKEADIEPDYQVYHPKTGLLPKPSWQRRNIPARIRDIGATEIFDPARDTRSERQMTYLLGARRLFDCGKKRWVWKRA